MLLHRAGETKRGDALILAGLDWYRQTQPDASHGYQTGIVDVSFLALKGEHETALETLREAVDQGWKFNWRWDISNPNLDSIRNEPGFAETIARLERETAEQLEAIRALPYMGEFDLRR
jgi:hypothetical protein